MPRICIGANGASLHEAQARINEYSLDVRAHFDSRRVRFHMCRSFTSLKQMFPDGQQSVRAEAEKLLGREIPEVWVDRIAEPQ